MYDHDRCLDRWILEVESALSKTKHGLQRRNLERTGAPFSVVSPVTTVTKCIHNRSMLSCRRRSPRPCRYQELTSAFCSVPVLPSAPRAITLSTTCPHHQIPPSCGHRSTVIPCFASPPDLLCPGAHVADAVHEDFVRLRVQPLAGLLVIVAPRVVSDEVAVLPLAGEHRHRRRLVETLHVLLIHHADLGSAPRENYGRAIVIDVWFTISARIWTTRIETDFFSVVVLTVCYNKDKKPMSPYSLRIRISR